MAQDRTGSKKPKAERLAVSTHEAAELLGVSERHLRTMVAMRMIRTVRLRGRVVVPLAELRRIVELPEAGA